MQAPASSVGTVLFALTLERKGAEPVRGGSSVKARGKASPDGLDPPDERPLAGSPSQPDGLQLGRRRDPQLHQTTMRSGTTTRDGQLGGNR